MLNKSVVKCLLVALPLAWVAGCTSTKKVNPAPTAPIMADNNVGVDGGAGAYGQLSARDQELMQQNTIHFDFDRSEIRPEYREMLAAHAQYLVSHPNVHVRIEGHTDERGSREYNIALGERRAQSVERVLIADGANSDQITIVSYGTERPAVQGHNEAAWAKNRRAVIEYEFGGGY